MSQLDELKKYTTVVADTGDIESIKKFAPQDATTNPSLVLKAAQLPQYQPLIADAIGKARRQGGSAETQLINACDQVAVDIGSEVLRHVPGRISTEVDARFAWDRGMCVAKARKLIQLYEKNGIGPERILIKLAATWEGIRAAEELEQSGINCNLTLLFSFAQARACAEAGVFLISPFVGRIYDWYQKHQPQSAYQVDSDPGGDRLTISPALLDELAASEGVLTRQLTPGCVTETRPSPMTQAEFLWQHHQDPMAVEKLAEGIRLFAVDQVKLEQQIQQML